MGVNPQQQLSQWQQIQSQLLGNGSYGNALPSAVQLIPAAWPSLKPSIGDPAGMVPAIDLPKLELLKKAEPRKVGQRVPDGIVPIVGWRAWLVANAGGGLRLTGLGVSHVWEPRKKLEAVCNAGNGLIASPHPAPAPQCACGAWAFSSLDTLKEVCQGYRPIEVLGTVSLWGSIIECENGYRAQFAYPKELWLFDSRLEELGYVYGVPVRTV